MSGDGEWEPPRDDPWRDRREGPRSGDRHFDDDQARYAQRADDEPRSWEEDGDGARNPWRGDVTPGSAGRGGARSGERSAGYGRADRGGGAGSRDRYGAAREPRGSDERGAPRRPRPDDVDGSDWRPGSEVDAGGRHAAASPSGGAPEGRRNMDIDLDEIDPKGHARRAAAARRGRGRPAGRRKKALKWASLSMAGVLLAVVALAGYLYLHFNANIKSTGLLPDGVTQAAEIPNKFGQTPLNILLLGNGGRINATDCKLGGACTDTSTDADTVMVVHLAADRSNMTVMSIPRDSIVNLPACAHDPTDLINASLNNGPACAVQTVHDVTGLTIDHFVEVDMSGVVTMSNALGGVPVCVTNNVYDSYSQLKLPKGTAVIQGVQALEWLRTRHAFINEVYREQAQHMFMAALLRKMQANASLSHVTTLYSVADAATKALTVDSGLGSVLDLLSLAQEVGKVPTSRTTFLSVPTVAYAGSNPAWKQQLQFDTAAADDMFAALKSDIPYTKTTAKTTSAAKPSPAVSSGGAQQSPASAVGSYPGNPGAVNKAGVSVAVQNGTGMTGRAGAIKTALAGNGFASSRLSATSTSSTDATALYYPSTRADSASAVAAALGIPASLMHQSDTYTVVTLVIGKDWTGGTTYGASGGTTASGSSGTATTPTTPPTAAASPPPATSLLTNGADSKACMYVPQPEW